MSHKIALVYACSTILAVSVFQVMKAYTGGLKAMKATLQAQPLSKEELEDVMDQLQDVSACARLCMLSRLWATLPTEWHMYCVVTNWESYFRIILQTYVHMYV